MHCVRAVMEISFGKTTVVASLHASHCLVAGHCGRWFGSVGPREDFGCHVGVRWSLARQRSAFGDNQPTTEASLKGPSVLGSLGRTLLACSRQVLNCHGRDCSRVSALRRL